jgi:predicted metal-dependent hydrolase
VTQQGSLFDPAKPEVEVEPLTDPAPPVEAAPSAHIEAAPSAHIEAAPSAHIEGAQDPHVDVVRSTRRRRTVSAHRVGERIVVSVPARISRAEEQRWVALMVSRILASEQRARPSDDDLIVRAAELSRRYLNGQAVPTSVRWVDNMAARWGSCTPVDGTIRLSRRLVGMPAYVVDYVLLHELAHLIVPGHGPKFWRALAGYDRLERARGFLEGVASAADQ